jgi:hypothetical protein
MATQEPAIWFHGFDSPTWRGKPGLPMGTRVEWKGATWRPVKVSTPMLHLIPSLPWRMRLLGEVQTYGNGRAFHYVRTDGWRWWTAQMWRIGRFAYRVFYTVRWQWRYRKSQSSTR